MKSKNVLVDRRLAENTVLRRYLDVPRFINFLSNKSLYCCRADLFQDKFEGSFTPSVRDSIHESFIKNNLDSTYENFKQKLREGVFINCWSFGVDDNMALWQRYGETNDCVAITTTVGRLKNELNKLEQKSQISIQKVDYVRYWKDPKININPYSNIFRYKAVGFEFEKEVRVISDKFESTFLLEKENKESGIDIPVDINTFLRSIVVSPESSPWFKSAIKDVSSKYNVSCPIRNSRMAKDPI